VLDQGGKLHGEHRCNFYSVPDATRRQAVELHTPAEEARVFGDAVGHPSGAREPSMSALTELMPATVDRIRPDLLVDWSKPLRLGHAQLGRHHGVHGALCLA
jgi:hypothetical protein